MEVNKNVRSKKKRLEVNKKVGSRKKLAEVKNIGFRSKTILMENVTLRSHRRIDLHKLPNVIFGITQKSFNIISSNLVR